MKIPDSVKRANEIDEPIVRTVFQLNGIPCKTGTFNDDWKHIDLIIEYKENDFKVDVKRNNKTQLSSRNFTFTFKNNKGEIFPFSDKAYFAFIDDVEYLIYLIRQDKIKKLVDTSKQFLSKYDNSKYILISKEWTKKNANRILVIDDFSKKHMQLTKNL